VAALHRSSHTSGASVIKTDEKATGYEAELGTAGSVEGTVEMKTPSISHAEDRGRL